MNCASWLSVSQMEVFFWGRHHKQVHLSAIAQLKYLQRYSSTSGNLERYISPRSEKSLSDTGKSVLPIFNRPPGSSHSGITPVLTAILGGGIAVDAAVYWLGDALRAGGPSLQPQPVCMFGVVGGSVAMTSAGLCEIALCAFEHRGMWRWFSSECWFPAAQTLYKISACVARPKRQTNKLKHVQRLPARPSVPL